MTSREASFFLLICLSSPHLNLSLFIIPPFSFVWPQSYFTFPIVYPTPRRLCYHCFLRRCSTALRSNRNSSKLKMKWEWSGGCRLSAQERNNIFLTVVTAAECAKGLTEWNLHSSSVIYSLYEVKVSSLFESVSSRNWEWLVIPTYRFEEQGVVVWFMLGQLQSTG